MAWFYTHTYKGMTLSAKEWALKLGISTAAFHQRLDDFTDADKIFTVGYLRKPTGRRQRHGHSKSKSHNTWVGMLDRCQNPDNHKYHRYGGRGITVCNRWLRFEDFLADMGEKPRGRTLDRINNDGNYEPGNCRWATPKQQASNTSKNVIVEFRGRRMTVIEMARLARIPVGTLRMRLARGMPVAKAAIKLDLRRKDGRGVGRAVGGVRHKFRFKRAEHQEG